MPLNLENEEPIKVKNANAYNINQIVIDIPSNSIVVLYDVGSLNGEEFVKLSKGTIAFVEQDFVSLALLPAVEGKTLYDNIKEAVYNKMMEKLELSGIIS